jgi:AbrB family looped-hinge helix DNA binding protein
MLATVISKGQVTSPKQIRDKFGLKAGSKRDFEFVGRAVPSSYAPPTGPRSRSWER